MLFLFLLLLEALGIHEDLLAHFCENLMDVVACLRRAWRIMPSAVPGVVFYFGLGDQFDLVFEIAFVPGQDDDWIGFAMCVYLGVPVFYGLDGLGPS